MRNSGPLNVAAELIFAAGIGAPSIPVTLVITNDEVALEEIEQFNLTISSPSDPRVRIFPEITEIFIVDDDGMWLANHVANHICD